MKIYGIYDITNKEQCVRIGTLEELIKFFDIPSTVKSAKRALQGNNSKYKLVYLFEEV